MYFSFLSFPVHNQPKEPVYDRRGEIKMSKEMQGKKNSYYSEPDIQNKILRRH